MKSGTAQKLVLNMISTAVMIKLGRIKGNKMVDMQLSNKKLVSRGELMLMEELGISQNLAPPCWKNIKAFEKSWKYLRIILKNNVNQYTIFTRLRLYLNNLMFKRSMLKKKLFLTGLLALILNLSGCSTSKPAVTSPETTPETTSEVASEEIPEVTPKEIAEKIPATPEAAKELRRKNQLTNPLL